jgi:formylglycine-generating enzyme required for sulfatase activity
LRRAIRAIFPILAVLLSPLLAEAGTNLVITDFESSGELTFDQLDNALEYNIEWAPSPAGPWTNTWQSLTHIPTSRQQRITMSVPMCYRVIAVVATGTLQVSISPSAAVSAGASWSVDGGNTWLGSGRARGLPTGGYVVSFSSISDWDTPSDEQLSVLRDQTTTTTGVYVPHTGSLRVTMAPTSAVDAGAGWSVDAGATWHSSGETLSDFMVGQYTLSFKPTTGWDEPDDKQVAISRDSTTVTNAAYVQQTGAIRVTLSPAGAASAGARWTIDGGSSWLTSGYTQTGLPVGGYTVSFKAVTGWNEPDDKAVTVNKNQTTTTTGVYAEPPVPGDMVAIAGAAFTMGDTKGDGVFANELPTHQVTLDSFHIKETKVSKGEWDTVYNWARTHGYTFEGFGHDNTPQAHASDHPVYNINWYDILKWCNARSERENRLPCYYTSSAQTTPYRQGQVDMKNGMVKWSASGYRLPTESEWEYAARNGRANSRFPWGDLINHGYANYYATKLFVPYDNDPLPDTYHPNAWPSQPRTTPVDFFAKTAYGIRDMAGNMNEWVWDRHGTYPSSAQTNPHGPNTGDERVQRGASYLADGRHCRVARRFYNSALTVPSYQAGSFRVVIAR